MQIELGSRKTFDYPAAFTTLPDYTAHAGQMVTVVSIHEEFDDSEETAYNVVADDGWCGVAWECELNEG
jgi:hypothetical protein